jgi:hypothetical protein
MGGVRIVEDSTTYGETLTGGNVRFDLIALVCYTWYYIRAIARYVAI